MKKALLVLLIISSIVFVSAIDSCDNGIDTRGNASIDNTSIDINSNETLSNFTIIPEETLLSEDFSSELEQWTLITSPTLEDESLTSEDLSIYSSNGFSSKKGLDFSFDVKLKQTSANGGISAKIVEKTFSSNEASVSINSDGTATYYIKGLCVTPTPQVIVKSIPVDDNFHTLTFRVHTDGTAEWLLDNQIELQRTSFDLGGDYTIMLSGSVSFGAIDNFMFLDNIALKSLAEKEAGYDICPPKKVVVSNPCPAGQCLSNGICCNKAYQYYCQGHCHPSKDAAMAFSKGQCTEWRIVC